MNDFSIKDFVNNFFLKHDLLNSDKNLIVRVRINYSSNLINFIYLNNNQEGKIFLINLIQDIITFEKLYYDIDFIIIDFAFIEKEKCINGLSFFPFSNF